MKKKVGILLKSVLLLCICMLTCMLFFALSSCQDEVTPINEDTRIYNFEDGVVYVYT